MKKSINILVLLLAVVLLNACGKKENKNEEDTTISNADAPVVMDEASKKEARRIKHERLEKIRAEKEKTRNDAYLETVKKSPTFKDESGEIVYNKAEVNPEFVGGQEGMNKWLSENLRYPQEAKDADKEGTVFIDFIIGKDGKVKNVTAESDMVDGEEVDQSLRMEAMRAVSSMPDWKPATEHGKKVPVKYSVPINFMLE